MHCGMNNRVKMNRDANDIAFLKQFQDTGEVSELNRLYFGDNPINIEKLY